MNQLHDGLQAESYVINEPLSERTGECRSGLNELDGSAQAIIMFPTTVGSVSGKQKINQIVNDILQSNGIEVKSTSDYGLRSSGDWYRINLTFTSDSTKATVSGSTHCLR